MSWLWRSCGGGTVVLALLLVLVSAAHTAEPAPELHVFVRAGCPHCEAAKGFLSELGRERPDLRISFHDVAQNSSARDRLIALAEERGIARVGVPAFLVGSELVIGFQSANTTGRDIRAMLDRLTAPSSRDGITTAWFGELQVTELGLPLFTIVVGLLDGFNPCAMWVLLFLLSLLVNFHDRAKMALIAGTFVAVSGLLYFAFMAAWLNVFLFIGASRAGQAALGCIALLAGAVNVKDFFAWRRGISLSIADSAKPGLYDRMRKILQAENLAGALAGVVVLAGLVNIVELVCTAGFPALYTQILALQQLPVWKYYAYLALYNAAYIFDDALMVASAVVTLSHTKLQERAGRWLKLVSGLVMVGLGALLLFRPAWLV